MKMISHRNQKRLKQHCQSLLSSGFSERNMMELLNIDKTVERKTLQNEDWGSHCVVSLSKSHLYAAYIVVVQPRKTENHPGMYEKLLTGT